MQVRRADADGKAGVADEVIVPRPGGRAARMRAEANALDVERQRPRQQGERHADERAAPAYVALRHPKRLHRPPRACQVLVDDLDPERGRVDRRSCMIGRRRSRRTRHDVRQAAPRSVACDETRWCPGRRRRDRSRTARSHRSYHPGTLKPSRYFPGTASDLRPPPASTAISPPSAERLVRADHAAGGERRLALLGVQVHQERRVGLPNLLGGRIPCPVGGRPRLLRGRSRRARTDASVPPPLRPVPSTPDSPPSAWSAPGRRGPAGRVAGTTGAGR